MRFRARVSSLEISRVQSFFNPRDCYVCRVPSLNIRLWVEGVEFGVQRVEIPPARIA